MPNCIEELRVLNFPREKYAIFGSGPLSVRGIKKVNDIDVIVKSDFWNELKKKCANNIQQASLSKSQLISIGKIEIFSDWFDLPVNEMIDNAEIIDDLPFVRLQYVIKYKKILKRKKDQKDLELIRKYLAKNNKQSKI